MCNKNSAIISDILNILTHSLSLIIDDKNLDEDIRNSLKADISKLRGINSALAKVTMEVSQPQAVHMPPPPPPNMSASRPMPPPYPQYPYYSPYTANGFFKSPDKADKQDIPNFNPASKYSVHLSLLEEDCKELISKINSYNHNNDLSKDDRVEFAILKRTTLYNEKGSRCLTSFKVFGAKDRILEVLETYGIFKNN